MKIVAISIVIFAALSFAYPISKVPKQKSSIVFALLEEGKMIEPIAFIKNGEVVPALITDGGTELSSLAEAYYKPGTTYSVVAGGKLVAKTTVVKHDPESECGALLADVKTISPTFKMTGNEISLATDYKPERTASGLRRSASPAEKMAIEKLVRSAFNKKTILVKNLKQVKLTMLDVDNDKLPEVVGTYMCTPKLKERAVLFFIATKNKAGNYAMQYSDVKEFREEDVMSNDITAVDDGIYQERLLDILDTDNSGVAKIFTTIPSFEGVGFNVYKRTGTEWEKVLDISNYHCAY